MKIKIVADYQFCYLLSSYTQLNVGTKFLDLWSYSNLWNTPYYRQFFTPLSNIKKFVNLQIGVIQIIAFDYCTSL